MSLPLGVSDPIFLCQLALELHMPVGELGSRMSNWELCVLWPAFFKWRHEAQERESLKQESHPRRRGMGGG